MWQSQVFLRQGPFSIEQIEIIQLLSTHLNKCKKQKAKIKSVIEPPTKQGQCYDYNAGSRDSRDFTICVP